MVRRNSIEASTRSSMAEIDDSELFRSSEFQANSDQADLKFLSGEYYRLVPTTSKLSAKTDSMEAKLVEIQKTLSQLCNQLGIRPIEAETSRQTTPVTYSDPYVHDDVNRLSLDNRKNLPHKIEMPKFDGSNAYEWLSKVERFFRVGRYSDFDKLDLISLSLEGDVLKWFNWQMIRREFRSWEDFRRRLLRRFGAATEQSPRNRLFALKQTGTISAYVTEFEELSSQVVGLDELHLEEIFYKGLKTEMRDVLKLQEPEGLENQKNAVLRMESSSFCQLLSDKPTKSWGSQKPFPSKPVTTYTQPRPLLLPNGEGQGAGQIVTAQPHILTVVEGIELEVLEGDYSDSIEKDESHEAKNLDSLEEETITLLQVHVSKLEPSLSFSNESVDVSEAWQSEIVSNNRVQSQFGFECVKNKNNAHHVLDELSLRRHKFQQRKKLSLSPKSRMFKFKNRTLLSNWSQMDLHQAIDINKVNNLSPCFIVNFGLVRKKRTFQCRRLKKQAHKSRILCQLRMLHDPGGKKDEHSDEIFDTEVDIDKVQRTQMDTVAESHSDVASSTDVITKGQTPACAVVKYAETATSAHVMQTADWDEACGAEIGALKGTGTCIVTSLPARCGWLVFDRGKHGQIQWTEIQTISLYKAMVADPIKQVVPNLNQELTQSHKFKVDKFGRLNTTRLTVLRVLCLLRTLFWSTSFKKQKFGKNWWYKFKHSLWQRECGRDLLLEEDVLVPVTVVTVRYEDVLLLILGCFRQTLFVSFYPFTLEVKRHFNGGSIDTFGQEEE